MEPPKFKKNEKIWINNSLIIKNGNKKQLKPRKLGRPFKIISKISPVSYKLDLPPPPKKKKKNLRIHPHIMKIISEETKKTATNYY